MRLFHAVTLCLLVSACSSDASGPAAAVCTSATAYTIGASASGSLAAGDCKGPEGLVGDPYAFTTSGSTSFRATLSASGFEPALILYQGTIASLSTAKLVFEGESNANAFIPAGSYVMFVAANDGKTGSYTLTTGPSDTNGCSMISYIFRGASANGSVTGSDCAGGTPTVRQDIYEIWMESGSSVSVTATSNKVGGLLFRAGSATSADLVSRPFSAPTGGTATFTYTATSSGYYRVHVLSENGTTSQANYSLSVN